MKEVHAEECQVFKEKDIYAAWDNVDEPTLSMDFMGAHRLLLAVRKDPKLRDLLKLNMNNEMRKERFNIKYYLGCEDTIARYISEQCGLSGFSSEEILTALGLFEILGLPMQNGAKGFFTEIAYMQQSCVPNTYYTINSDGVIVLKASVNISKGETLTRCFADVMKCNQFRRKDLEKEYFVDCNCSRCNDWTEFGTYYGGLIALEYNNHIFTPSIAKDENSPWVCDKAPGVELDGEKCSKDLDLLRRKCENGIAETQGNPGTIEFILCNPGEWDILPKQGQVMMDVKKHLVQAYGNSYGNTYDVLDNKKIQHKIEICEELLQLYSKFHPGFNYNAAMLHYEAANAIGGLVAKGDKSLIQSGVKHCEACLEMIQDEQPGSMYDQLRQFMMGLQQGLQSMI